MKIEAIDTLEKITPGLCAMDVVIGNTNVMENLRSHLGSLEHNLGSYLKEQREERRETGRGILAGQIARTLVGIGAMLTSDSRLDEEVCQEISKIWDEFQEKYVEKRRAINA